MDLLVSLRFSLTHRANFATLSSGQGKRSKSHSSADAGVAVGWLADWSVGTDGWRGPVCLCVERNVCVHDKGTDVLVVRFGRAFFSIPVVKTTTMTTTITTKQQQRAAMVKTHNLILGINLGRWD
jgi:hypothetical protein